VFMAQCLPEALGGDPKGPGDPGTTPEPFARCTAACALGHRGVERGVREMFSVCIAIVGCRGLEFCPPQDRLIEMFMALTGCLTYAHLVFARPNYKRTRVVILSSSNEFGAGGESGVCSE